MPYRWHLSSLAVKSEVLPYLFNNTHIMRYGAKTERAGQVVRLFWFRAM